jgi:hypothetical protein
MCFKKSVPVHKSMAFKSFEKNKHRQDVLVAKNSASDQIYGIQILWKYQTKAACTCYRKWKTAIIHHNIYCPYNMLGKILQNALFPHWSNKIRGYLIGLIVSIQIEDTRKKYYYKINV